MVKTFKIGGIHPCDNKLTGGSPIDTLGPPKQAIFPLSQHIGAPAIPCVERGDMVYVGTKIAEANGFVSANIYSSVSGKVAKIDNMIDATGYSNPSIVINVENDIWEPGIDTSSRLVLQCLLDSDEILEKIREAGIVGLGGACFPTHVKLSPPSGCKIESLIINGVECEPYLTSDHRLMLEHVDKILVGISILMKALKIDKAYIGIEENKQDAIDLMKLKSIYHEGIEIVPLRKKYPQGGEKQLISAILNRCVPAPPCIPANVGTVVLNVATVYAVYEAVQKNKPLIERIVTVTGKSVKNPCNLRVRLGTPVEHLINYAGGMPENTGKLICGGPMMGKTLLNTNVPVVKGTSGILLLDIEESVRIEEEPCIRCAKCVQACPMGLEPYLLRIASERSDWETAEREDIMTCIECGCCQSTCPSHRPLLDWVRLAKIRVGCIIRTRDSNNNN